MTFRFIFLLTAMGTGALLPNMASANKESGLADCAPQVALINHNITVAPKEQLMIQDGGLKLIGYLNGDGSRDYFFYKNSGLPAKVSIDASEEPTGIVVSVSGKISVQVRKVPTGETRYLVFF
ncbi:MAG: hypothetical protein JWQ35_294 [Bacteriovoracaceae bacterium]|nr:hypothetical protein [Bacteriovoracaceae bacterium]